MQDHQLNYPMSQHKILAIDVGGSFVKCGVVSPDGTVTMPLRFDTRELLAAGPPEAFLSGPVSTYLNAFPELRRVGIGLPGYLSTDRRQALLLPNIKADYPLDLSRNLGKIFPALDIILENDANCAALGEYTFGAAARKDCLLVTMGTGIGSGAIIDGLLFRGSRRNGMELGHMLHAPGLTVEEVIGKKGIISYAATILTGGSDAALFRDDQSFTRLLAIAATGNVQALSVFDHVAQVLGQLLYNVVQVLDLTNIYIGGGISVAFDFIYPGLLTYLNNVLPEYYREQLIVTRASLGNEAGLLGAAVLHLQNRKEPLH